MGVASPNNEPCPSHLVRMSIFWVCTNNVCMTFFHLFWFRILKNPSKLYLPGSSVLWPVIIVFLHFSIPLDGKLMNVKLRLMELFLLITNRKKKNNQTGQKENILSGSQMEGKFPKVNFKYSLLKFKNNLPI